MIMDSLLYISEESACPADWPQLPENMYGQRSRRRNWKTGDKM
jgi:hypothetical protein